MKYIYQIMLTIGAGLLLVYLGAVIGASVTHGGSQIDPKPKVDTLFIQDSTMLSEPISEAKPDVVTKILRIPYPVEIQDSTALMQIDSLLGKIASLETQNDSLFLVLKRVQKEYRSPQFAAWVSGYDPALDSMKIFQTTRIITKEIPVIQKQRSRWGVGIHAGYGASREGLSPYVGVGVSYNILSW